MLLIELKIFANIWIIMIIKRFSVDSSTRTLVYEELWSGFRMAKRTYPFDNINKFDLQHKRVWKGLCFYHVIDVLVLIFQSGKIKYLTYNLDQAKIVNWGTQLNNMLKNECGFPAERFSEPLSPHHADQNKKTH